MSWYLRPNKTGTGATTHVVVDTESRPESVPGQPQAELHRLLFGHAIRIRLERGAVRSRQTLSFTSAGTFWEWLLSGLTKHRQTWLWGHRVAWDFLCLEGFRYLPAAAYYCKHPVLEDPPVIMHWWAGDKGNRRHLVVLDSMNWWRTSLALVGESVGLQKLAFPETEGVDNELAEYCIRDAKILELAVLSLLGWVRRHDLGVLQKTAPSQALQVYRHRFGPRVQSVRKLEDGTLKSEEVVLPCVHGDKEITKLERSAYYGGECQSYYIGHVGPRGRPGGSAAGAASSDTLFRPDGPVYHVDHTAFYPSLMRGKRYPCRLIGTFQGCGPARLKELLEAECLIAQVDLSTPELTFPRRESGKLMYPVGRYYTVLAGPELETALRHNLVECAYGVVRYEGRELFTTFVDEMWGLRQRCQEKGDLAGAELCKLVMNGLYGKFGQRAVRWQDDNSGPADLEWGYHVDWDYELKKALVYRGIAGSVQRLEKECDSVYCFPAIPAYVTSHGRERMRRLRSLLDQEHCYYQHTDSLHVSQCGYDTLVKAGEIEPGALGKLRLVETVATAEYRGLNDYTLGERVVMGGVRDPAHNYTVDGYHVRSSQRLGNAISREPLPGILVKNLVVKRHNEQLTGRVDDYGWVHPVRLPRAPESQGRG